jgi:hypothetical protein
MRSTSANRLLGRTFLHPALDYLLIGGALSLVAAAVVALLPAADRGLWFSLQGPELGGVAAIAYAILLSNSAHFASSTVRLYTKPGARDALPFLSYGFPAVCIGILTLCVAFPVDIGRHLQSLYMTWSPYHYAAQAYGLGVMYCFRSGCFITGREKKLLWWGAMMPFFYAFLFTGAGRTGLRWLLPFSVDSVGWLSAALAPLEVALPVAAFALPGWLFWRIWRREGAAMPLISLLTVVSNGVWWFVMPALDAFLVATVFHGIQYLVIITIFHVRDQRALPDNRRSGTWHTVRFYALCLALGYALFHTVPYAYMALGFGPVESFMLVAAAINLHHFIVDGYIWRLKKGDANRRVVDEGAAGPGAGGAPATLVPAGPERL